MATERAFAEHFARGRELALSGELAAAEAEYRAALASDPGSIPARLALATVFLLFPLTDTGNPWLLFLGVSLFAIGNGFTYGQQAAYYTELFPASIRYSGVSITYAIGAILGGAFAPTIAAWLVASTGTATSVAFYIAGVMVIAFIATLLLRDRTGIPLGPDHEAEQAKRHFIWEQ